jgi:hypothetical protein
MNRLLRKIIDALIREKAGQIETMHLKGYEAKA